MPKIVDHQARRWEICATAAALIAEAGLEAATIRDIANTSGYSKGVIEHYFDSKEELIAGALDWANRCYEERVYLATRDSNGLTALRERLVAILPLNTVVRNEWRVRLVFWSLAAINADLRKQQQVRFRKTVAFFAGDIEAGVKQGQIASPESVDRSARHLVNMTAGICIAALHNPRLYTRAMLLEEVDYLLDQLHRTVVLPRSR